MTTITRPKNQRQDIIKEFNSRMYALGAKFNTTWNHWNVPDAKAEEAIELRGEYPDKPDQARINGSTVEFI